MASTVWPPASLRSPRRRSSSTRYSSRREGDFVGGSAAPLLAVIIVGASLGFLRHNFHPARIFMGDSGSMLLGLVLGAATVLGSRAGAYPP